MNKIGSKLGFIAAIAIGSIALPAFAIQMDWGGQFWLDQHWLNNYQLSRSRPGYDNDPTYNNNGSPYVPGRGEKNVVWYSAFLKLKPKLIVNDSVNIRSEFHVGSPIYGFLGRSYPSSGNARYDFTGSQRDSMSITAQRFWANLVTDFGTVELGRAPIHWGLGAMWNSGDKLFDRFQSTGDMVRLTSKFGNFVIQPGLTKVTGGSNVAGATVSGNPVKGNDDITDYNLGLRYDNSEEDFELGLLWTKRSGNAAQRTMFFNSNQTGSTRIGLNMFDFYARKKLGRYNFGLEVPFITGEIGAVDGAREFEYRALGAVFEGAYTSDMWDVGLKAGHVPGQPNNNVGDTKFNALYLNNNYQLGLIMFHYNLYGLANNNPDTAGGTPSSPYDNGIVNANYVALTPEMKLDKWTLKLSYIMAFADKSAASGKQFYSHEKRQFATASDDQSNFMGWETDFGVSFKWDENFVIGWDIGLWSPGDYYEFSNVRGLKLESDTMFASQVRAGINF